MAARSGGGHTLTLNGALSIATVQYGLGRASVTKAGLIYQEDASAISRVVSVGLFAIGLGLFTGHRRNVVQRVDGVALADAAWTIAWLGILAPLPSGFEYGGTANPCLYADCWPRGFQELAIVSPAVVAVISMIAMATLGRRKAWWLRASVPAGLFVVLSVVQIAAWDMYVVPLFDRPPPFT